METYTISRLCWNCHKYEEIEIPKGQIADTWKCDCPNCGVPMQHQAMIAIVRAESKRRWWPW
jgi:hypothetical protein